MDIWYLLILQDEHASLSLELNQQDALIARLREDNKNLLDRWLDAKRDEAERMNEANEWIDRARKVAVAAAVSSLSSAAATRKGDEALESSRGGGGGGGGGGEGGEEEEEEGEGRERRAHEGGEVQKGTAG
ncbi:hypothetical protein JCM10212_006117 [Sporobolomyces blumeae]